VTCGNGSVEAGEDCDDGNRLAGDGCSAACTVEPGYTCTVIERRETEPCQRTSGECVRLPIIYRDFLSEKEPGGHPDFVYLGAAVSPAVTITNTGFYTADQGLVVGPTHQSATFSKRSCIPNTAGIARGREATSRCWDLVQSNLGADGKPVFNAVRNGGGANASLCHCQFTDWSHDTNGGHVPGYVDVTNGPLYSLPYVAGRNGHPVYRGFAPVLKDGASFARWFTDNGGGVTSTRLDEVLELTATGDGRFRYTSPAHTVHGGFFPLDPGEHGFPLTGGSNGPGLLTIVPLTGEPLLCNIWPYWFSSSVFGNGAGCRGDQFLFPPSVTAIGGAWVTSVQGWRHNYWFTSESRFHFVHGGQLSLQFDNDDDLYLFINGVLVVDLGGVHQRIAGRVDVTADGMAEITEGGTVDPATGSIIPCPGLDPSTSMTTNALCPPTIPDCDCRRRVLDLGLVAGRAYEIAIFHADRHPTESEIAIIMTAPIGRRSSCQRL
jgi:fibro-slime domain-containing protein